MGKKKPGPPIRLPKDREATPSEMDTINKDMSKLTKLGFEVISVTVEDVGEPAYDIKPPEKSAMHEWRMALEKDGFEVVSRLHPDNLGFAAKRRVVTGKGWS